MGTMEFSTSTRHGAMPAAPYFARPPSPPSILIPAPNLRSAFDHLKIVPNYEKVDPASLSADDLEIITQNYKEQLATDSASSWTYESRRVAQPILDFLYLGPSSVARDRDWLRETGITMLLAARDSKMADIRLMAVDRVAQELGIQAEYVDVSGYNALVPAFPVATRAINDHMLKVFRGQSVSSAEMQVGNGKMAIPGENLRRGKVLVFCESGNDRSASVVVAYLMSIFGMGMVEACQFVHFRRFCVSMGDELRHVLKAYEEILSAQRTVHRHELDNKSSVIEFIKPRKSKRGIEDTMDEDKEMGGTDGVTTLDEDRFLDRPAFAPFIDMNYNAAGGE